MPWVRETVRRWSPGRGRQVCRPGRESALWAFSLSDGTGVSGTARTLGVSRPSVIKWRDRFSADGVDGLRDRARRGRPKTIDDAQIVAASLDPPPESLAVTPWSTRLLGNYLGISDATVSRRWRAYRAQPWRQGTFQFFTDSDLEARVRDVVGLSLETPRDAIVLCVDAADRSNSGEP